jgi:hypothetical protein
MIRNIVSSEPAGGGGAGAGAERCSACAGEVRCECGSLLARRIGDEIELKCRRCKRTWRIPLER